MIDFNLKILKDMILSIVETKYSFIKYEDSILANNNETALSALQIIILRHDVDLLPENAIKTAKLEHSLGIQGTYYFRIIAETFRPDILREIANMGHEIGYHYEDMDLVRAESLDRQIDMAFDSFKRNLEKLRRIVPINTICMHGSPSAKHDNKIIWEKYDYKSLGIVGEPYLDINWNEFGYLTDTGRRWNGNNYSVRDKVNSKYKFNFKTTQDIINNVNTLPDKMMITLHPQRWTDNWFDWTTELIAQNIKNSAKFALIKLRGNN